MVPTRIRQWTSRLRAAPMWETLAATLSVMLLLGLAPPVPPIRWLLSGILISAAYAVTVAAIACFVKDDPKYPGMYDIIGTLEVEVREGVVIGLSAWYCSYS